MADDKKRRKKAPVSREHKASKAETTLNRVVKLILEAHVLDHSNHRVEVKFIDKNDNGLIHVARDRKQGFKVTLAAPPEPIARRREHPIELTSSRRGVLKRTGEPDSKAEREALAKKRERIPSWRDPLKQNITPENVEYRPEHWPSERRRLRQGVYTTQKEFDALLAKDNGEDDDLGVNRILVQWDPAKEEIVKCIIDGEEVEFENRTSGKSVSRKKGA